jgi:predicted nucleic acid-binding Zn ribbon protein
MTQHSAFCVNCGRALKRKHTGWKRRFCSDRCRDQARKGRKSAFRGTVLGGSSRQPRNAGNSGTISKTCKPVLSGRASVDPQLWRAIVEVEVFAGRDWREVTSGDGVKSEVAVLRPRALREVWP